MITLDELNKLECRINQRLLPYQAKLSLTDHAALDRLNHPRNKPPITLDELEGVLGRWIDNHIESVIKLSSKATFNIKCGSTHINMPCELEHFGPPPLAKTYIITIMRKKNFIAKDVIEYLV